MGAYNGGNGKGGKPRSNPLRNASKAGNIFNKKRVSKKGKLFNKENRIQKRGNKSIK